MGENALGMCVAFAAENFAAVDIKAVEKILFLSLGLPWRAVAFSEGGSTNRGNPALTFSKFPGCTLKYG